MKRFLIAGLALVLAVAAEGAVAIYSGSVSTRTLAGGESGGAVQRVYTVLDLGTGNTVTLSLGARGRQKTYRPEAPVAFVLTTATDRRGASSTVLARAQTDTDALQAVTLQSAVLRGKDAELDIGQGSAHLPRTLAGAGTTLNRAAAGNGTLEQTFVVLHLDLPLTREVNRSGLDLDHALQHLEGILIDAHYADERSLPPAGAGKTGAGTLTLGGSTPAVDGAAALPPPSTETSIIGTNVLPPNSDTSGSSISGTPPESAPTVFQGGIEPTTTAAPSP